ncbi:MAG: ERCC4 domain-containing protein [Chloroflexota bacterium]
MGKAPNVSPGMPEIGLWVLERCPGPERFPYRLTIARTTPTAETMVLRVADRWPKGTQNIFCLRETTPPRPDDGVFELERVPIVALQRSGAKLTVVLDRPRLRRCDFLFLKREYKNTEPGRQEYEQIFWKTQRANTEHRPRVRLTQGANAGPIEVRIAADEKYPWRFPEAVVSRGRLACGDYAFVEGDTVRAVVERKTFDNLLVDFGLMDVLHQRLVELAAHEHHAMVVEAPYEDFLNPQKAHHWGPGFCARAIAELYARHPRLRLVFLANRKTANAWAEQYFAAVARLAEPATLPLPLGAESPRLLPPQRERPRPVSAKPTAASSDEPLFPDD